MSLGQGVEAVRQIDESCDDDMNHEAFTLQASGGEQQPCAHHHLAIAFEDLGPDNEIGNAFFILERAENHTACRSRPLPANHQTGHGDIRIRRTIRQGGSRNSTLRGKFGPQQCQWMRSQGELQSRIIVKHFFSERRRRKRDRRLGRPPGHTVHGKERKRFGTKGPNLPEGLTAIESQRTIGISPGQSFEDGFPEAGLPPNIADVVIAPFLIAIVLMALGPGCGEGGGMLLFESLDLTESQTERDLTGFSGFQRAIPIAERDVDRPDLNPMIASIANDLCRRIEAHGLTVQERTSEYRGIMTLDPR